ncbi:cytochrome c oxidase subunit 4 [Microbacterium sp. ZXX196]|uniref:aa3-type cytochrome oxidase subunit IV n=1 Tax=Microbacterium sp. ZXX196 TaxID=2609291 RepID=UPI0012B8B773|nr:cytochrome c oxidase subunit 4 [Microbacterium sp. ZXX196]MTE24370.1 cytochrome c oxidase subunit 4 [Microbacterium sp. ZXX196]
MKSQIGIWWLLTGFFFLCFAVYTAWNIIAHGETGAWYDGIEWVGSAALLFLVFMSGMISFFIHRLYKAQHGVELPEDRLDADIDDGEMEQGEFSPWSWWPLVLAAAPAVGMISLATAHFLIPVAAGLLIVGLVGWVYEYYRGNFAR